jgi:voltage-gated potassium channel
VDRLVSTCGSGTPDLWRIRLDHDEAPALQGRLDRPGLRLADLLRDPTNRDRTLDIVPLTLLRNETRTLTPDGDVTLVADDQLLVAGRLRDRALLATTMTEVPTASYVIDGRHVPSSWVWRRFARVDGAGRAR